jgi:predicted nuclease of predicted toxin-antitoxin system
MKLLLDANISWRLMNRLQTHFEDCHHVDHIGLSVPAKDVEIWDYALEHGCIIVTNDEDFLNFSHFKGFPPKVVLLRTGNQRSSYIEALLIKHKVAIASLNESEDYGLLEIFEMQGRI